MLSQPSEGKAGVRVVPASSTLLDVEVSQDEIGLTFAATRNLFNHVDCGYHLLAASLLSTRDVPASILSCTEVGSYATV